ncbi:CLMP1-like protein [Drosera capensis]
MGKSGGRKKKSGGNPSGAVDVAPISNGNGVVESESAILFLKRAHELKEEGNRRFQAKDYVGALEQYENAIKITPRMHPDRAVFHSNRAACLMQMRPVDYERVVAECNLALKVDPCFVRALLRRARAYEAMGKSDLAMIDVNAILDVDRNHGDALDIGRRLRVAMGPKQDVLQDLQSRPSPAALGASAVRGAPVSGLGPCLPARPAPRKSAAVASVLGSGALGQNKVERSQPNASLENGPVAKTQMPKIALKLPNGPSKASENLPKDDQSLKDHSGMGSSILVRPDKKFSEVVIKWRPLKLVYDHDIRLAEMPANCSFKVLRGIVSKRFPSSKSVLIKYMDSDGDLVTITCSAELKLAEHLVVGSAPKDPESDTADSLGMLRLHIVDVDPEQEPPVVEEEEKPIGSDESKGDETGSPSSLGDSGLESVETEPDKSESKAAKEVTKGKAYALEETECKDVEIDDWLFEFAQLFRTHVGIDPDAHIDLHEIGMELSSEALEQTVTSEEAQLLFNKAALKFQEVAALAFFNWGNVHMCAARKRIPLEDSAPMEVKAAQLQVAYDWVNEKYSLAKEKYEQVLLIKPDFYEGLLALGQQQFEMAKLQWSYASAKKVDLTNWDATETLKLFDSAEAKMKEATEMWEKLEEQRANELKDPTASTIEELIKKRKKQGIGADGESSAALAEPTPEELAEQAASMRSQIHLFWGNMLFERSQIEFKLRRDIWKEHLDGAIERFKLAGAPEADISNVSNNHCSNVDTAAEGNEKKADDQTTSESEAKSEKVEGAE